MLAWIDTGAEGGPGDGRHGRAGAAERRECAGVAQGGEVRHPAGVHQACGAAGVHAVETDDHHASEPPLGRLAQRGDQEADGERQQRQQTKGNRHQKHQERPHDGKTGSRPDIGERRRGHDLEDTDHARMPSNPELDRCR